MNNDLSAFKRLLRQHFGLVFEGEAERRLERAIASRMCDCSVDGIEEYLSMCSSQEDEARQLLEQLTIHETYFFREYEQVRFFVDTVVPGLLKMGGSFLRILVSACSSGEEPYSLAIALKEKYGTETGRLFSIIAGDVSRSVLQKACAGRYRGFSFRGVSEDIRSRYFENKDGQLQLREDVRRLVSFHELNLLAPGQISEHGPFDAVFMRNVSIYFDIATRRAIHEHLARNMTPHGILLTSSTETLANDVGVFELAQYGDFFFFRLKKNESEHSAPERKQFNHSFPSDLVDLSRKALLSARRNTDSTLSGSKRITKGRIAQHIRKPFVPETQQVTPIEMITELLREDRKSEAVKLVQARLVANPRDARGLLLRAYINLNQKQFESARSDVASSLQIDPGSLDAHYLYGLIEKWVGDIDASILWFRKVVYLRFDCWPAHFLLSGLYAQQEEQELSRREATITLGLLDAKNDAPGCIETFPTGLRSADTRFICERRLQSETGKTA